MLLPRRTSKRMNLYQGCGQDSSCEKQEDSSQQVSNKSKESQDTCWIHRSKQTGEKEHKNANI